MVKGTKGHVELFIFNICSIYISLVCSNFNFEEIYGVKYGFEISKEPVLLKESPGASNTVLLSSKHGQQYQCILPQLEALEKKNEDNQIISKDEIPLLLEPLKKKCLYNNKGWWTYEVCFGKGIYQYHEEANQIVGDKISLGIFGNETNWSQEKIAKVKPKPGKSAPLKKFHSQYYINGSDCDLTGKARETQIKIYCEEGSADVVLRVDEPLSCSYVITVYTNKLCKHSLFRSAHTQEPQAITCSPALSEERYKIYIEGIESKKRAKAEAEIARKKARAAELDAEDEIEEDENEKVSFARKRKRSMRSQVWPWENPGIESEDEVWIDGRIENDKIDIHRFDITKGRKTNEKGQRVEDGLSIMSQKIYRKRADSIKGDTDEKGKGNVDSNTKQTDEIQEQTQAEKTDETQKTDDDDDNDEDDSEHKDIVTTGKDSGKDSKREKLEKAGISEDSGEEQAATPDAANKKIDKETPRKELDPIDEKWIKKMEEAVLKLRSSLKEKLVRLGLDPKVLDQKFQENLRSLPGDDVKKGESLSAEHKADEKSDGLEADKKSDGQEADEKSDGQEADEKSDGLKIDEKSDGLKTDEKSDGQEADEKSDGLKTDEKSDGQEADEKLDGLKIDEKSDGQEADKLQEKGKKAQDTEKHDKTPTNDPFMNSLAEMNKIFNEDMMKEILDVAAETQAEMERQFNEERARMKSSVEEMRAKIKEIEDAEEKSEVKNEQLGQTMSKIKASIDRFENTNKELGEDMQSIKEVHSDLFRAIGNEDTGEDKHDLLQQSLESNRLLRKILLRRFQLEQEAQYIKTMSNKVANREEDEDISSDLNTPKGGIDKVINKLKTMIQDLDVTGDNKGGVTEGTETASDSRTTAGVRGEDQTTDDQGDARVKVRVSRIKKVVTDDGDDGGDDAEMTETDLDTKEMEELNMEKRIQQATKKMEEMVKRQLRDSGVTPSGKIRVKIVTSKEALENMDGKSDVKLLSEREETQFRDMILGLLGGTPEAGRERRRQQDLESSYNLVWNDDGLQEIPREDDDADGEVEVESF